MSSTEGSPSPSVRRERLFVGVFLFLVSIVLAHFVHGGWTSLSHAPLCSPAAPAPAVSVGHPAPGTLYAPAAYRIALPALIHLLFRLFHPADGAIISTVLDFCFGFAALWVFYSIVALCRDTAESKAHRLARTLFFLGSIQFPLAWVVPWQRPETTPSALYLAVALLSLLKGTSGWTALLLAATLCQAFIRSDVAFVLGAALVLLSCCGSVLEDFGPRRQSLFKGFAMAGIAGAAQLYLQQILFPHLTYSPDAPVFQWRNNLTFHYLQTGLVALLPCLLLVVFWASNSQRRSSFDALVLCASGLYLVFWFLVGSLAEVRIFVPFMLAMCVVASRVLPPWLAGREEPQQIC